MYSGCYWNCQSDCHGNGEERRSAQGGGPKKDLVESKKLYLIFFIFEDKSG